ncbi:vomeronasal type-2 receptor 26-like [Protopterus annectens]|uniref:vomeronasal type-2 receptor 26-like n=1 Tax=Protopterus annectens TaxID=7888 RepID=UPI001CFC008A|nr:vomeronasal type-2 receptor 26-like [Protopterus annectens]
MEVLLPDMGEEIDTDYYGSEQLVQSGTTVSRLLHYVKNVFFEDTAGEELFFDINGDSPVVYDILNWQVSPDGNTTSYVKVGYFDSRAPSGQDFFINESLILWNGDNTQIPQSVCSESCSFGFRKAPRRGQPVCCFDCIPCSKGEISNQTGVSNCIRCPENKWPNLKQDACILKAVEFLSMEELLGSSLAGSTIFLTLITASTLCIFIKYRDTPIVKANNRDLSYFILFSLFVCFLCPLIFIGQPNRLACLLRQISFGIIFSFCVSGILAKTITVVIAFKATKPNGKLMKYVGPRTPYFIVFSGSLLQVILCIIWLAMSPPFPELNFNSEEFKIIVECKEGSFVMFYCMLGYLGLLASICFVVAFLARTLPDTFNEAKFISFSMIVFVSVWLSFIPAYLSTKGKYMVAVEIFAIMASGAGIIICIFIPKCYIILLKPQLNIRGPLMGNANFSKNM